MPKTTKNILARKLAATCGPISARLANQVKTKTWKIAGLLDHRLTQSGRGNEFLVVWDDSTLDVEFEPSWEPEANISRQEVTAYWEKDAPVAPVAQFDQADNSLVTLIDRRVRANAFGISAFEYLSTSNDDRDLAWIREASVRKAQVDDYWQRAYPDAHQFIRQQAEMLELPIRRRQSARRRLFV